jgi:hypothetical protein
MGNFSDRPLDEMQIPAPPPDVGPSELWYEVGKTNAKMDILLDQLPTLDRRMRSLERSRTQVYTAASIFTAGAGALAAYGRKLMEFIGA